MPKLLSLRLLGSLIMIALLLAGIAFAWMVFSADLDARVAHRYMDQWPKKRGQIESSQWKKAQAALNDAISTNPYSVDYRIEMGQLYEWAALDLKLNQTSRQENLQQALYHYRQAASRRPTWPYSWAAIAYIKSELGQVDEEMLRAFRLADEYGHLVPRVQLRYYWAGLSAWDQLPEADRQQLVEPFSEILQQKVIGRYRNHPRQLIKAALFLKRTEVIEPLRIFEQHKKWLSSMSKNKALCSRYDCIPHQITRYKRRFH